MYFINRQSLSIYIGLTFGFIFGVLISFYNLDLIETRQNILDKFIDGNKHILEIEIDKVYKHREGNIDYVGKILKLDDLILDKTYVLVKIPSNFNIEKGFILKNELSLNKIENFSLNFNYIRYLQSKDIYSIVYNYSPEKIGQRDLSIFESFIYNFRNSFISKIHELFPRNEALFLAGILIGAREELDKDLSNNFNNSGLTHLIAVSGFNITIIIIFLSFLFKYFPVFLRIIFITSFIIFFTLVVGDFAAVIRASIMGLIGYFILISGRSSNSLTLILITAFFMLIFNPLLVNYDIGFHLSFLAVIGLLYLSSYFEKIFYFLPSFFAIRESFVLTISALITTLPIMIINFGYFSVFSILTNMLVGWTIPFAMLFGFISIIFYIIKPIIGVIIGFIAFLFLKYVILVVNYFGSLSFSVLDLNFGVYTVYLEILYFMFLVFIIFYLKN